MLLLILLCTGCATRKHVEYVDREVIKYNTIVKHDTLIKHTHDSIYHTILQHGDTVYDTKYIEKTKYVDKKVYVHDTIYRDSIRVQIQETTKIKEVTPKWCYYCLAVCIIFVIVAFNKILKWLKIR